MTRKPKPYNTTYLSLTLLFTAFLSIFAVTASAQNADEIIRKMDQKMRGNTSIGVATMKIIRPSWSRSIHFKFWSKTRDFDMILITAPARDEGSAFLRRKREIWNWVPRINRVVKLPPSMMSQSWMGSDFKNDDLIKESSVVTDYTHSIVGDSTLQGHACYKIKMVPKPNAPVVWGKVFLWVTKDRYLNLRAEYYDEDGHLVNTMEGSDIKNLGGRDLPSHMEMVPADKKGQKTVLDYQSLKFDTSIPDDFFSLQNMKHLQ